MQVAKFQLEDGRIAKFEVPDNITPEQAFNLVSPQLNELNNPKKQVVATPTTAAIPERTYGEVAKDVGAAVATGLGGLGQFPGQLYGLATGDFSDTGLYGKAKELEKYGESLKSPGLVAREKASQARIAEAEKEGQVSSFFTAIKEIITDPVQLPNFLISQSLQSIPSIAAALVPLVGPAASAEIKALQIAAKTATSVAAKTIAEKELKDYVADVAIKTGTRQAIGVGAVQQGSDIGTGAYEDIYKKLISQNVPEDQAAEKALGLARASGASGAVISLLAQKLPGARVLEERLAGMRFGSPDGIGGNIASRIAGGVGVGLKEGLTEIPEEVGGKFTQNLAMQQVDPTQALSEGLGATGGQAFIGGFGLGTVIGSLTNGDSARIAEEKRSIEQAKLQTQKEQALEQALNQQNLTKKQLGITEEQQLGLPTPDELFKQTVNPLFNPFGNYSAADLGINPEVDAYVKQHRQLTGKPNIESYSIEDIQDAMPGTNTVGEKAAIDSFLTARTGYTPEVAYTPQDIQNVATQKNIETKTKGFDDFLTRTTGISNVAEMSQPQLHAAFTALAQLPKSPDLQILPQGTNATRFTEDQYKKSIESLKAVGNNLSREDALNKIYDQIKVPYVEPVDPIAVNKAPNAEAEQRNKTYFEDLQRKNAESILSKALRENDLETVKVSKFDVIAPDGSVTVSPLTRGSAERIAAQTEGFTVKESSEEKIAVVDQNVLPKGFDIQQQSFKQDGVPGGYQIKAGNVLISPTAFATEEEATNKVKNYEAVRAKQIEAIDKQLTKLEEEKTTGQNKLDAMEVSGSSSTPAYRVASAAFDNQVRGIDTKVVGLNKQKELLAVPLQIIPTGSAIRSGFTVFEQGIPKATLPTKQAAEEHIIANASDETLKNISTSPTPNRLRSKANEEINRRAGKVEPGIRVAKSPELEKQADVENQAQMTKLEEALKPILAKFGLNTTKLKVAKEIDGGKAEASYVGIQDLINIAFDAVNPVRALRHESVHALKELGFFTDGQWKALVNQANTKWINKYLKQKNVSGNPLAAGEQSRYEAYMKAYDGNQEAIIEEAIADAFADFDVNGAPAGFMAALLTKIQNFFKALLNALNGAGFQTAEDVFGKVERGELQANRFATQEKPKSSFTQEREIDLDTRFDIKKANAYEEKNGIAPYLSVGDQYLPTTGGEKYSLKTKDKYGMYEGIPLNNDGTITVYYHTTKADAMGINKAKRISPSDDKRVYLTNESSGALVLKNKGLLPQKTDGSVVMLKLPPEMMQFVDKYPDGRVDMFIPLAEGDFFNQKMRVSAIQVSKNKAILDKSQTFSYKDHAARMSGALTAYEGMSAEGKKQAIKRAAEVLREQHNIGTLLTTNGKLEKTSPEAEGLSDLDVNASSMGLGMAAAQKITDKLSSCPNSAICADLCLGDTAGGNQQYGGVAKEDVNGIEKSAFRAGPRMVQYLKTEALVIHPEEFVLVLSNEIQKFKDYERSTTIKQKNPETGKRETVEAEVYEPSIRLNVTSDFAPEMFKPLLDAHPDVVFYDYTKLQGKPVAPNHHLTYSSTGFAQMINGKLVQHKMNNWNAMRGKLDAGFNVAMAFTSKSALPKTIVDEETSKTYQVWDGDNYDARYLDPKREDGIGMIVGLRNKAGTMKERESAAQTDGFFADYDPKINGDKVVVPNQNALTGRKVIPITKEKFSLRAAPNTPEFKRWFGNSKVVDENGKPMVMYHGTITDITSFEPRAQGGGNAIWLTPDPEFASSFAVDREGRLDEGAAEGGNVMPVYVRATNTFDYEKPEHLKILQDYLLEEYPSGQIKNTAGANTKIRNGIAMLRDKDDGMAFFLQSESVFDAVQDLGFDSMSERFEDANNLIVFKPTQIKSAIGNTGAYDAKNPDIRYSLTQKINSLPNSSKILDSVNKIVSVQEQTGHVERMVAAFSPKSRSNFRAAFIDRYNQIGVNSKQVAKLKGENWLLADVSAEAAANMSDLATGVSASALGVGQGKGGIPVYANGFTKVFNDDGKIKGAVEIFSTLAKYNNPEIYRMYQWWAGSLRGKRLLDEGREYSYTKDDIKLAEELLVSFPEFEQVQKEWIVYNDGLVKYAVDTGVLTKEAGEKFREYGDYIPFYRQIDGEQTVGPNIFSGISGVKGPKTLKGNEKSEAPLADFLETIVRNTQSIIESGMKNVAAERTVRDAVILGQAEKLDFQPKEFKSDVVSYQEKGKTVYYKLADPALYEAMKGLNIPDMPWLGILSAPANLLRTLVTKDPGFMLVNLMRDSVSAWVTSGSSMTPIVDTMNQFVKTLAGKSPEAEALMLSGVLGGYDFASNVESGGRDLAKYLRKKTNTKTTTEFLATPFTSIWEALEKGSTASDAATRAAIYRRVMDETGNEAEAIYRALEVLNFNRKGNAAVVRILTAVVPFLNARIQGLDVLYRASFGEMASKDAKAIQKAFIIRSIYLMGMTALYYAATSDDEEYKKQEQEVRDNNWLIPSLGIKIPIPFEIGVLFKVIPERIMAYHYGTDTGADLLKSAARNIVSTFAFNPVPQAIIPFVETATNYSFFTGREIVPRELEDVSPEFQTNAKTSGLAKRISSGLADILPSGLKEKALSPIQIDHIVNGYTGTLGMYASSMLNSVFDKSTDPTRADLRLEQMPVLRRILIDKEARGNATAYYDLKNSTDTMVRTINLLEKTQNFEELGKYQQENLNLLATQDYMKDLAKMMKELSEYSVMIKSSQMDGASKRDALLAINQAQNNVTANIKTIRKMLN